MRSLIEQLSTYKAIRLNTILRASTSVAVRIDGPSGHSGLHSEQHSFGVQPPRWLTASWDLAWVSISNRSRELTFLTLENILYLLSTGVKRL